MFEENAELALLSRSQLNNTAHDSDQQEEDADTGDSQPFFQNIHSYS